jgi:hypothetical protein
MLEIMRHSSPGRHTPYLTWNKTPLATVSHETGAVYSKQNGRVESLDCLAHLIARDPLSLVRLVADTHAKKGA